MEPDVKFWHFIHQWAAERGCTFVEKWCNGSGPADLIDGMEVDDVWGWLLKEGETPCDDNLGMLSWSLDDDGKLQLEWET